LNIISIFFSVYSSSKFHGPENVYIFRMMNATDRSLAIINHALWQRFVFHRINPLFDKDSENGNIFRSFLQVKGLDLEIANDVINKTKAFN